MAGDYGRKGAFANGIPSDPGARSQSARAGNGHGHFLGDGEFDSPELQAELEAYHREYACRMAKNIQIGMAGEWLNLAGLAVQRGQWAFRKGALFTQTAYGPAMVIAWWATPYEEPVYLHRPELSA